MIDESIMNRPEDLLQTILEPAVQSRDPESVVAAQVTRNSASAAWTEEERRNVAALFTLLDQWDRELNRKREAA